MIGYTSVAEDEDSTSPTVSRHLDRSNARHLAAIVDSLPTSENIVCRGIAADVYQIDFVAGYACAGLVEIATPGGHAMRHDARCSLFDAVRSLVPRTAAGTRDATIACQRVVKHKA